MRVLLSLLVAAAFGFSCSGQGSTVLNDLGGTGDAGETTTADHAVQPQDLKVPDPGAETYVPEELPDFGEREIDECGDSGCFGDACLENADCQSALCMLHMGENVCTDYCVEECPEGWSCKQVTTAGPDAVFACVSNYSHLCLPCADNSDCTTADSQNACVVYQGQGTFCGASCDASQPCPSGYECEEVYGTGGAVSKQCVNDAGVCECTGTAVKLGLSTACVLANEFGSCEGLRVCLEDGLSPCDAKEPAGETCNGLDDECDGETDEDSCDDANECTTDGCDPVAGCNHELLDGIPCNDGNKCTSGDVCVSGSCDGMEVKCNDGNPCTDDLCDETTGCFFHTNTLPCDDGDPCTLGDHCEDEACVSGPAIACDDGNSCTDDLCDAAKGCIYEANSGECDDGNQCTAGDHCSGGQCTWTELTDCDDGNLCTTDACLPEQGCISNANTLPCDDGNDCTTGDKCTGGECVGGDAAGCDDSNPCTNDTCNPLVGCIHVNNNAPCDDFDPCTESDACSGGQCVGTGLAPCGDDNPCTDDFCVPMGGCSHNNNQAPCSDDNVCTVGDLCAGGACSPGQALTCEDANPCTADSCDPLEGCSFEPVPALCDDSNDCTTDDHCSGGKCVSDQAVECDDGNPCTTDICTPDGGCFFTINTIPCNDGNLCTTGDKCQNGECVAGVGINCDDQNVCTGDSCVDGVCQHQPAAGVCDDGNPCTVDDFCHLGACKGGGAENCDDDNLCTTDYCDPGSGCFFTINTIPCSDGSVCTTDDSCANGTCTGGAELVCNDGNACTDDACLPDSGCQFAPNDEPCDDGNSCTNGDHCAGGVCAAAEMLLCNDSSPCTSDACLPASGCVFEPLDIACSDSDACTTNDWCVDGQCAGGPPADCGDGNQCTDDSCDPAAGCLNAALLDGDPCDDGNACTETDQCLDSVCTGSDPPDCDDGKQCTDDYCVPADGCQHNDMDGGEPCNDLDACTQTDQCAAGACVGSNPPTCNDNEVCTTDSCEPAVGCVFAPVAPCCGNGAKEAGEECDDGNHADGDGCSADCENESPCPTLAAYVNNYCWVKAIAWQEGHSAACSRIGKQATSSSVPMAWNNTVLTQVAAHWGFGSIGDFDNSATSMWCNNGTQKCGTHNWGSSYTNYGPYGDSNYWPVYTCNP